MLREQEAESVAVEKRIWALVCLVVLGLGWAPGPAEARTSAGEQKRLEARLVAALGAKDAAVLERAARRLGVRGLLECLRSKRRQVVVAALEAAPLVEKSWILLAELVRLMSREGSVERSLASKAASSCRAIAEDLRRSTLDLNEDGPDTLRFAASGLYRVASDLRVSIDVRVSALLALAQMTGVASVPASRLRLLLADPDPRVREAAVELFAESSSTEALGWLAELVAGDTSLAVARAAASSLCARVPARRASRGSARKASEPQLRALEAAQAGQRMRELATSLDARDDQLLDLARCLIRVGGSDNRRALAQIRRRSRRLRRLLRKLR
jgi:hypothetical protein